MGDPFNLRRFVEAQAPVIDTVVAELGAGRKRSHWMWFVFPQIQGLGHSPMAQAYAIASAAEARAYRRHAVLGPRLDRCTTLVLDIRDTSIETIFGAVDARKFQSSMTLFARVSDEGSLFQAALKAYFGAEEDAGTLARL